MFENGVEHLVKIFLYTRLMAYLLSTWWYAHNNNNNNNKHFSSICSWIKVKGFTIPRLFASKCFSWRTDDPGVKKLHASGRHLRCDPYQHPSSTSLRDIRFRPLIFIFGTSCRPIRRHRIQIGSSCWQLPGGSRKRRTSRKSKFIWTSLDI